MTARRSYSRHGMNALKARLKLRGFAAVEMRTVTAQALFAWRRELLADLRGHETVSAQQMALTGIAVRTRLYVNSLDAMDYEQDSLVNHKRKRVMPALRERQ